MFASDNGPQGETAREMGNQATPDMGNAGPFRGELGEATEGAIRTFAFIRWPGHVKPDTTSYAMFSIMDFFPTLASIVGGKLPTDRPIDGVDQSDVLFGKSASGHRESLLTFIGWQLVAERWKQWRIYFTDIHPTGIGPQRLPGMASANAPMAGYPKVYNIEMDPHEDHNVAALFGWVADPALGAIRKYEESLKKYPKPAAAQYHGLRQGRLRQPLRVVDSTTRIRWKHCSVFSLDVWDYITFAAISVIVFAALALAVFILGLPGRATAIAAITLVPTPSRSDGAGSGFRRDRALDSGAHPGVQADGRHRHPQHAGRGTARNASDDRAAQGQGPWRRLAAPRPDPPLILDDKQPRRSRSPS